MRYLLTVAVLVLDVWAILAILDGRASARSKFGWTVLVLALPLVGFLAWRTAGPNRPLRGEGP